MKSFDVIVLGAGAAGLMCAITAGGRGRRVLVLERANKVGKKILMSGGGRCNFTNLHISPENYLSANPHFCKSALSRYTQWDFIELVNKHGIAYHEKAQGQLFCDESSKQILAMLLEECEQAGVVIHTRCEVEKVSAQAGFSVSTNQGRFECTSLVVATGGLSIPKLGGSGFGYELAGQFGLKVLPRRAGLAPFTFTDSVKEMSERLTGVSLRVAISTVGQGFTDDILFTHRGLSGPAVLQLSSYWREGEAIKLNLLPDRQVETLLKTAKQRQPKSLLRSCLAEYLPKKLVLECQAMFWPGFAETALAEVPDQALRAIAAQLSAWTLKPAGTEGYRTAEVTLGGVDTNGLSSQTMECKTWPGLYFVGEVMDVTGHLGGYNFQWAWSSAYAAGCVA